MTPLQTALATSLIPFVFVWIAILNPFFKPTPKLNASIQAIASGFIIGSILFELAPRLLSQGLQFGYIVAFVIGVALMMFIANEESSCCSGGSETQSLVKFLLPFTVEFIITAMLIGIAAVTQTSLSYIIAISFGLCNFVCGSSILSRFTTLQLPLVRRLKITFLLSAIFPVVSVLTLLSASYVTTTLMNELIAFAVALLLYLVTMELLPEALTIKRKVTATLFFSAVTVVALLIYL